MTDEQRKKVEESAEFQTLSFVGKRIFLQSAQFALSNLIQEESKLKEYQDREERFILTMVKLEHSLNLLEKVQANEPEEFKRGIDHIKKSIRYVIDKNIDRLPSPPKINS